MDVLGVHECTGNERSASFKKEIGGNGLVPGVGYMMDAS